MDRTRANILLLYLTGVFAAAQLAKFSALAPLLRVHFGFDLPQVSLLVSLLEVGGALFGFVAGLALGRTGARVPMLLGLATLTASTAVETLAPNAAVMFAARAVEGIGYVMVVISAPTTIVAIARNDRERSWSLALWSTFVAVGMGVGNFLTGGIASLAGWQTATWFWALACLLALLGAARIPMPPVQRKRIALPPLSAWLLTGGFGCYTIFLCAMMALLPTFLIERHGSPLALASGIAAAASLAALPGAIVALRARKPRQILWFAVLSLVAAALTVPFVYRADALMPATAIAVLVVALSGVTQTLVFTRIPAASGAREPADPRIASTSGLLTQFGAGGALIGPPLGALAVVHWGWNGLGLTIAALMVAMLALFVAAERVAPTDR